MGLLMERIGLRSVIWLAPALLLAAGCGGENEKPDPCENVTCGTNATCSEGVCACNTGFSGDADAACTPTQASCEDVVCGLNAQCQAGECLCKAGYEGDADEGCTPVPTCTDTSCSGHGECSIESGQVSCACDAGYAGNTCTKCATGYKREGGVCVVDAGDLCADLTCADNGECVVTGGKAACECVQGWAGESCDACAAGYDLVGTECVKEQSVPCDDQAPENATSNVVQVTIGYDGEEWSDPAACAWECDEDYVDYEDAGECINTRQVDCVEDEDALPEHAVFVRAEVDIPYTTADGWADPAVCAWKCEEGFRPNAGACIPVVTVDSCFLLTPSLGGRSDETFPIEGKIEVSGGELSSVSARACRLGGTTPACTNAVISEEGDIDGVLTFPAGTHSYLFQVSVDDVAWTNCGSDGADEPGEAIIAPTPVEQLQAVRDAVDQSGAFAVTQVVVTVVEPDAGDGKTRFFVQAAATGPGVYVLVDDVGGIDVGDTVAFTATEVTALPSGVVAVTALEDFTVEDNGSVASEFFQNLETVADVAGALDDYESELVVFNGFLKDEFVSEDGFWVAPFEVKGSGALVGMRISDDYDGVDFEYSWVLAALWTAVEQGCEITVRAVMWRDGQKPQPTVLPSSDLEFEPVEDDCAMPFIVISANAVDNRTVVVEFLGDVDAASITDVAEQFVFVPALEVKAFEVDGNTVTLTTGPQEDVEYTLSLSGVTDMRGYGIYEALATTTFDGVFPTASDGSSAVVITQVYGGGGNAGATYDQDFVELFNRSASKVYLDGLSIQYAAATSENWSKVVELSGTIEPGGFYLLGGATGNNGDALPTPQLTDTGLNLAATAGKVILVDGTDRIPNEQCPSGDEILDFVGFGTTVSCPEATGVLATNLSATKSASRKALCVDTEVPTVVSTTLVAQSVEPAAGQNKPRNSDSNAVSCSP